MANKRCAILVGVGKFEGSEEDNLKCVAEDLKLMKSSLEGHNYEVFEISDRNVQYLTLELFKAKFTELLEKIQGYNLVLFYFSGHGINHQGKDKLVFSDSNSDSTTINNFVELEELLGQLISKFSNDILVLIDACRTSFTYRDIKEQNSSWGETILPKPLDNENSRMNVVFSCGKNESSQIISNSNHPDISLFTKIFCASLEIRLGSNNIDDTLEFIAERMPKEAEAHGVLSKQTIIHKRPSDLGVKVSRLYNYSFRNSVSLNRKSEIPTHIRDNISNRLKDLNASGSSLIVPIDDGLTDDIWAILLVLETLGLVKVELRANSFEIIKIWQKTETKVDDFFFESLSEIIEKSLQLSINWQSKFHIERRSNLLEKVIAGSELLHTLEMARVKTNGKPLNHKDINKVFFLKPEDSEIYFLSDKTDHDDHKLPEIELIKDKRDDLDMVKQLIETTFGITIQSLSFKDTKVTDFSMSDGVLTQYDVRIYVPAINGSSIDFLGRKEHFSWKEFGTFINSEKRIRQLHGLKGSLSEIVQELNLEKQSSI